MTPPHWGYPLGRSHPPQFSCLWHEAPLTMVSAPLRDLSWQRPCGASSLTVRNVTSSVSKTNPNITIAWEVPFYNVCKTIHILVSNSLKTSSGVHASQKLPKKQTPSLASSIGTCHIAQQHVDGMLIFPWYDLLLNMALSSGICTFSKI